MTVEVFKFRKHIVEATAAAWRLVVPEVPAITAFQQPTIELPRPRVEIDAAVIGPAGLLAPRDDRPGRPGLHIPILWRATLNIDVITDAFSMDYHESICAQARLFLTELCHHVRVAVDFLPIAIDGVQQTSESHTADLQADWAVTTLESEIKFSIKPEPEP
jgi:hypothetical protein